MKKKIFLIILIDFIFILLLSSALCNSFADWDASDVLTGVENYDSAPDKITNPVKNVMATAITVMRVVGTGIALIMITYVAIKYMTAAGQERAEFKKSAIAFVAGAFILFAASNIITIIANFATKI